jgi:murein DD-endopeptidase MepM/ murein hydrolase activator NlpD
MNKLELWFPLDSFVITQNFGENLVPFYKDVLHLLGHTGIDMVGSTGQIVRAAHDGVVTYVGYDSNEGHGIVIRTKEPVDYGGVPTYFKTIYWHLLPDSERVKVDQEVKCGDIIAQCDSTGVLQGVKYGPDKLSHLHFGLKPQVQGEAAFVWMNAEPSNGYGGAIDPAHFFNGFYAKDVVKVMDNLTQQVSLLTKVVALLKSLFT